jgi:ABC-2 type transport system permease protein
MNNNNITLITPTQERRLSGKYSISGRRTGSRTAAVCDAFLAIWRRDLIVARREFLSFMIQALFQPFFFLFVFGKVLPLIGAAQPDYATFLLPGMVAMTTMLTTAQSLIMPLVLDLGHAHEIEDRLLAPLSVHLVALEKVLFATLRGLIGGAMIFPLAAWMFGAGYQVRGDTIGMVIGLMILTALASAAFGLTLGSLIQPAQMSLIFAVVFMPLIYTGCTFYPWIQLNHIPWFMVLTLLNPLTYASEGLRAVMMPPIHGHLLPTLPMIWVLLGLSMTTLIFLPLGMRMFHRRVIS